MHKLDGFHRLLGFCLLILGRLLQLLEEGTDAPLVLHFKEMMGAFMLLLGQFIEKEAQALQIHIVLWK